MPEPLHNPQWLTEFAHPREIQNTVLDTLYLEDLQGWGVYDSDDESSDSDSESEAGSLPEGLDDDVGNGTDDNAHPVRRFMRDWGCGGTGSEQIHFDEEEVVSEFCEAAAAKRELQDGDNEEEPFIALADIRSNFGVAQSGSVCGPGISRGWLGGLTKSQLQEQLGTRTWTPSEWESGVTATHLYGTSVHVDRVIVSLPGMDDRGITTLAMCGSLKERPALKRFFYGHIRCKPCIHVGTKNDGFSSFEFYVSLPFFALRYHRRPYKDQRTKPDGSALRDSLLADRLLGPPTGTRDLRKNRKACIYEVQASFVTWGVEDYRYNSYGTLDTYYDPRKSKHTVEAHISDNSEQGDSQPPYWDPLSLRRKDSGRPIWDTRVNFLLTWAVHLEMVVLEMTYLGTALKKAVDTKVMEASPSFCRTKEFSTWNDDMMQNLNRFIDVLSQTNRTWEKFNARQIRYFISGENDKERMKYIDRIGDLYMELKSIGACMEDLKKVLNDNQQRIQTAVSFHNGVATSHVLGLTIILFCTSPFTAVTGMFNMQNGALPFDANPGSFSASLVVAGAVYLAAYGVYFYWKKEWATTLLASFRHAFETGNRISRAKPVEVAPESSLEQSQPRQLLSTPSDQPQPSTLPQPKETEVPRQIIQFPQKILPWSRSSRKTSQLDLESSMKGHELSRFS